MKKIKFYLVLSCFFCITSLFAGGKQEHNDNLFYKKLNNGLEVFVCEDDTAPLAYIEIAIRGGGRGQTKETAGLFHLYEHMMFKGNSLYKDSASVQKAIMDFGVVGLNGSTSSEFVNYYFTIPSSLLEKGLEFWSVAIRNTLLSEEELENEKKVVISELVGRASDPGFISKLGVDKALFYEQPWKLDPAGPVKNIEKATVKDLREIQKKYYIPNNAALFIGGDVNHDEVFDLVNKIYGDWQPGNNPWENSIPNTKPKKDAQPVFLVIPREDISFDMASVVISYYAPNGVADVESTYPADILCFILENPNNKLGNNLYKNPSLEVFPPEYTGISYITSSENGVLNFSTVLKSPTKILARRVQNLEETLSFEEFLKMASEQDYFSFEEIEEAKRIVNDNRIVDALTPERILSDARFFWVTCSADYYFNYYKNLNKVKNEDIVKFVRDYLNTRPAVVTLYVNSQIYELQKNEFENADFIKIDKNNFAWYFD